IVGPSKANFQGNNSLRLIGPASLLPSSDAAPSHSCWLRDAPIARSACMLSHLTRLGGAFANAANPQSLFLSHTHASALNLLSDLPEQGRNLRLLVGEAGMGKTMLLVHLLERFKSSALTVHLFWTQLADDQFLRYFLHELGVLPPPENAGQARKLFSAVLERAFGRGRKVIVAIDEA